GRPEAAEMLERVVDIAVDELGIDPVEIRRRNLLGPDELPLVTQTGAAYDSGDYPRALEEAVRLAGYDALRAEQARRRERGERREAPGRCSWGAVPCAAPRTRSLTRRGS